MAFRRVWAFAGCVIASTIVMLVGAAAASADGDPASDVLLGSSVFYPYVPPVSPGLQATLNAETFAAANSAGFPIKVALIASPFDLGAAGALFGRPQQYADFLEQEIGGYAGPRPNPLLLVVMPDGYGIAGFGSAVNRAAASLSKPKTRQSDDLARAAIAAVQRLAAAAGDPISNASGTWTAVNGHNSATPKTSPARKSVPGSTRESRSSTIAIIAILAGAAAVATATGMALRLRLSRRP